MLAAEELEVLVLVDDRACAPGLIPLHGLALWLTVKFADGRRVSVLLDGGPLLQALVDNALELSIQLESCDLALLTLWHFHHANAVLVARRMGILRAPLAAPYLPGSGRRLRGALYSEVEGWGVRRIELGGWWREVCYVIKLEGKGLVVFVGCSIHGLSRTIRALSTINERSYAIIGGLGLSALDLLTLRDLEKLIRAKAVEIVVPLHSTGPKARDYILRRWGKALREHGIECCGAGLKVKL